MAKDTDESGERPDLGRARPTGVRPGARPVAASVPGEVGDGTPAEPVPDERLMADLARGDQSAVAGLYDRYSRASYSLARRICGDDGLAEEVVQEVFLGVWRDPSRFDPARGRFSSWLLTMTHHKAVDAVRRATSAARRAQALSDQETARSGSVAPGADHEALGLIEGSTVRGALARLPDEQRRALYLMYYGGYTQREVASLTGVPLGTVKSRMFNAVRQLRRQLGELALDTPGSA